MVSGFKTCATCGEELPWTNFGVKVRTNKKGERRSQLKSNCSSCRSNYGKKHYRANRQKYIDRASLLWKEYRSERRAYVSNIKRDGCCVDCGTTDASVLEFDHVRGTKIDNISSMMTKKQYAFKTLVEEINKCVLRCSNCHRKRHLREGYPAKRTRKEFLRV